MQTTTLETLAEQSLTGDKCALEELIRSIQDRVFGLAVRMLYHPADAEDAAQEILVKIVTHLDSFRGESAFTTWMFRVAANHLLSVRSRREIRVSTTFEEFEARIVRHSFDSWRENHSEAEQALIVEEIRISCLQAALLCMDRDHRLAYILGEIFDVNGEEGAAILEIAPAAYRKRLSRARTRLQEFMSRNCSLVRSTSVCKCANAVAPLLKNGRLAPKRLVFATHPGRARKDESIMNELQEMDELKRLSALFKGNPGINAPASFVESMRCLISSDQFKVLGE